jgi:type I restriction enzyme R subunit
MQNPSFKEDHISQIAALQMLINLGYTYLTPEEALRARGTKTTQVLLDDILRKQLKEINSLRISSTKTSIFSDVNIEAGIRALKEIPLVDGYIHASESAYNLLTLGKALEQSIDDDKKSFTLQYIDWKHPEKNAFHVTEEYNVMRTGSKEHYRPDIVLFVNGIPLCIIECKRPDMKDPIGQAISQHLRNQQKDGIRPLYIYAQSILSLATDKARFATVGTPDKFWSHWEEKFGSKEEEIVWNEELDELKNTKLDQLTKDRLFENRFRYVRRHFEELESERIIPTEQDKYLFGLCSHERLLDFAFNFIIFDNGEKKIARYQQYFAIKKAMRKILHTEGGKRKGGVIWHTQGSGKSLTMVMLAQAIALEHSIKNPKIVLVTDRTDLDEQITGTFRKCGIPVENAPTGSGLVELLQNKSDAVITTVINKFNTAIKKIPSPLASPDIFVLVDEGHRSQYGLFNIDMLKTLPNACFIAFTGTPLFKKDKNTLVKFGTIIDDYTVDKAVQDKAVVPLLYEGRFPKRRVHEKPIDDYFDLISEPLNRYEKADLKKKMSRADHLNSAQQLIYAQAWDISLHYRDNFKHTSFKGQLVCDKKDNAIRYKNFLDEIGIISTQVLISPPDEREGEDSAYAKSSDRVKKFWAKMMDEHGNAVKYQKNIINRFNKQNDPEIIIVVDKLLTGFDAPRNTVLYLTRKLQGHTLLQAIARVNRIYPDKDCGYIIDYYGVLGALDEALSIYSSFDQFEEDDLAGTLTNIAEEVKKLPQKHSELWDLFKTIQNKRDAEAYEQLLRDESIRVQFYEKLAAYARILKIALSSIEFHKNTEGKVVKRYKDDLDFFMHLRKAVIQRYSDAIDYKQYEGQIQKLIDTHIQTDEIKPITELVNIFDKEAFQKEVKRTAGEAAKADKIASRTAKHINEKMGEDPAFYRKFSEMLKDTIREYEERRISETQYLSQVKDIMNKVLLGTDTDIPEKLKDRDVAKAFYGIALSELEKKIQDDVILKSIGIDLALSTDEIIKKLVIVDWQNNLDIIKKMIFLIGDYLIDEIRDKYKVGLSFDEVDQIAAQLVEVAKIRYK